MCEMDFIVFAGLCAVYAGVGMATTIIIGCIISKRFRNDFLEDLKR